MAVCSLIPCFVGYEFIHVYERYAWILITVIMLFLWGLGGHAGFNISAQETLEDTGKDLVADVLSFGGIVFGSFNVGAVSTHERLLTPLLIVVGTSRCRLQLQAPRQYTSNKSIPTHFLRALDSHMLRRNLGRCLDDYHKSGLYWSIR